MFFFTLSGTDVDFLDWKLWQRTYTTQEALSTIKQVESVEKKEFAAISPDPKYKTSVVYIVSVYVASLSSTSLNTNIHPFRRLQIAGLIAKKAFTIVFAKYANFTDVFSLNLVSKLSKYIEINNHAIKLVNSQQPIYGPIYSLKPVEFEALKAYIETNLANRFMKSFKLPENTLIFFN